MAKISITRERDARRRNKPIEVVIMRMSRDEAVELYETLRSTSGSYDIYEILGNELGVQDY